MAIQDKIRLTGLLRKKPRERGFFYADRHIGLTLRRLGMRNMVCSS